MNCEYIITTKDGGIISIPSSKSEFSEDNFYEALSQLDVKELSKLSAMIQTTKNKIFPVIPKVEDLDETALIQNRIDELNELKNNRDSIFEVYVADNMLKITPESAAKETGGRVGTSGDINVSLISKSGVSVEAASEFIHDNLPEGMAERYSDQDIRNIIIDILKIGKKNYINDFLKTSELNNLKLKLNEIKSKTTIGISDNVELVDTILTSLTDNFGIKTVKFNKDNYSEIQPLSIEDLNTVKAFSKNGVIYVNETEGTIDEPLHEFMHLILNTLKSSNPELFQNIVKNMYKVDGYEKIAEMYPNLTRLDLNEEAFVRLFSEKATQLMQNTDLLSAVNQTLTDIFKPNKDTSKIDTEELLDLSIIDFINTFGSGLVSGKQGLYNKSDSNLGAQILNIKQNLIESNDLKETC